MLFWVLLPWLNSSYKVLNNWQDSWKFKLSLISTYELFPVCHWRHGLTASSLSPLQCSNLCYLQNFRQWMRRGAMVTYLKNQKLLIAILTFLSGGCCCFSTINTAGSLVSSTWQVSKNWKCVGSLAGPKGVFLLIVCALGNSASTWPPCTHFPSPSLGKFNLQIFWK